jgi:hypothetical protein
MTTSISRIALWSTLLASAGAFAFSPQTHTEISVRAARSSTLDSVLKGRFGEVFGIATPLGPHDVQGWVGYGGEAEDEPSTRCFHHFHDPLKAWGIDAGILDYTSSVIWQQDPLPPAGIVGGGHWSWPVARQKLFDYLTRPTDAERGPALADLSRALGQMMHLLQDAHSPAHTRHDLHNIHDNYEAHVEEIRASGDPAVRARWDAILNGPVTVPDPAIFYPTNNSDAPARIARLIDTDTFDGSLATYATGNLIGGAEYTNGGYVSDDSIFNGYALPRIESIDKSAAFVDGGRKYYPKVRDGDSVPHFVAEGTLTEKLEFWNYLGSPGLVTDDRTVEDAAARLVPRAVGYSTALIDEFFREQIEIAPPDRYVYGRTTYQPDKPELGFGQFTRLRFKIRNNKSDAAMGPGKLTVSVRYRFLENNVDSFKSPQGNMYIEMHQSTAAPIQRDVPTSFTEIEADFSNDPIPVNAVDMRVFVVFQGPVGEEPQGVAFGIRNTAEPDPIDYANASDWECVNGTLYQVTDPALPTRDVDGDGSMDLFGPLLEVGVKTRVSLLEAAVFPTSTSFDLSVAQLGPAQAVRDVILQDRTAYAWGEASDRVDFTALGSSSPGARVFEGYNAAISDVIYTPDGPAHFTNLTPGTYRGYTYFHLALLIERPTAACLGNTINLLPNLSFLPYPPVEVAP